MRALVADAAAAMLRLVARERHALSMAVFVATLALQPVEKPA